MAKFFFRFTVLDDIVLNHIIPVATRYQSTLLDNVYKMCQVYDIDKARTLSAHDDSLIEELSEHISSIKQNVDNMVEARKQANHIASELERAANNLSPVPSSHHARGYSYEYVPSARYLCCANI